MTPRLLRGPTGSVGARHGPWATKRRARPRNGGATAARRAGGACIAPRATPIPTGRTARGKKCAPCPCPRRPGCLAGLRVSRPGSAPFASTPPPPLPILGPKMASAGGAWRAVARAGAGPRTWDSACGPRPMVPSGVRGGWPRPSTHARATPAPGGHRSDPRGPTRAVSAGYDLDWDSTRPQALRPTPASVFLVFHSGSGMRKIVFQVIQYKPFQILVESLWEKCLPQASLFSISGSERVSRYQDLNGSTNSCFCV